MPGRWTNGERKRSDQIGWDSNIYGSPIAAANRVYIADRGGRTVVIEHGEDLKTLSLNRLKDSFSASPIASDRQLILRGEESLYVLERE